MPFWYLVIYRIQTILGIFFFWCEHPTSGAGAILQLVLLLVSRAIIGSGLPRGVWGAPREDRDTPGDPEVRPEASPGVPGWFSSTLEGPRLARDDVGQSREGGRDQVRSYRDRTHGKWRWSRATVHLPLDVTWLRDTSPAGSPLSERTALPGWCLRWEGKEPPQAGNTAQASPSPAGARSPRNAARLAHSPSARDGWMVRRLPACLSGGVGTPFPLR